jgi:hypothetical protein
MINKVYRTILWKLSELILILVFILSLYSFESQLTQYIIQNEYRFGYIKDLHAILFGLKNNFLPCKIWLLMWPCLLVSISLIIFKRWRWYFIGLMGASTTIFLAADKLNYIALSSLITISSFRVVGQLWDVKNSIKQLLMVEDILKISFFMLFFIWGAILNRYLNSDLQKNPTAFFIDKVLGILFFILFLNSYNSAFYIEKRNIEWIVDDDNNRKIVIHSSNEDYDDQNLKDKQHFSPPFKSSNLDYAVSFGIINFHLKNAFDSIRYTMLHRKIKSDELDSVVNWLYIKKNLNNISSPFRGIAKGRNVFLVAVESLNPGVIGLMLNDIPVTPILNRLKNDALFWNRIMDQDHSGGSSDSEFALMTGLLPSRQYLSSISLPGTISLIGMPEVLRNEGYETFSFHGNKASFWNRNINHPLYGIQKLYFKDSFKIEKYLGMGVPDVAFFTQSVDLLSKENQPFFAYLITLSSHHPYQEIPLDYKNLFMTTSLLHPELTGYLQIIRYTDDAIGKFIQTAKDKGFWENSIFIFYGDHIPPMNPDSLDIFKKLTGIYLRDYKDIRIPLMILIPGQEQKIRELQRNYEDVVGDQHDIFPTILHLLGIEIPFGISGVHLFIPNDERDPLYLDNGVFIYKGIIYHGPTGLPLSANFLKIGQYPIVENLSKADILQLYLKSQDDFLTHEKVYEFNAQSKAIEIYKSKNNNASQIN